MFFLLLFCYCNISNFNSPFFLTLKEEHREVVKPPHIEENVLYWRKIYHFGLVRISWHVHRYHRIKISSHSVYETLKRNGMNKLPEKCRKRSIPNF